VALLDLGVCPRRLVPGAAGDEGEGQQDGMAGLAHDGGRPDCLDAAPDSSIRTHCPAPARRQLEASSGPRAAREEPVMSVKSRMMMRVAKKRPHYLLIPLIPLSLTISSFVMSLLALRNSNRLAARVPTPG
jgi:hypothetical protein